MASAVLAKVAAGSIAATLSPSTSTVVTVDNNSVTAQANGNQAMNALNAVAVSGISTNGSATNPTFAVLNSQTTNQTVSGLGISAVLNATNLGTSFSGVSTSTTANAQGNQLQAIAYGNSASNAIGMSPLTPGLNTASAAITNVQYNLASISASVTGASVAVSGALSGGSVNVSGNTITAQVVGNRAVNSITAR